MSKNKEITEEEIKSLAVARATTIRTMREKAAKAIAKNLDILASIPDAGTTDEQQIKDAAKCKEFKDGISDMVAARHGNGDLPGQTTMDFEDDDAGGDPAEVKLLAAPKAGDDPIDVSAEVEDGKKAAKKRRAKKAKDSEPKEDK